MNYGKRRLSSRPESVTRPDSPPAHVGETQDNAKRRVRNMTEKKRRDQFNQLISELANIVCSGSKKPDKTNVLQMTIEFLKRQKSTQSAVDAEASTDDGWKPPFMSDDELLALLMEAGGSFVVVFSREGTVLFISGSASTVLGLPQEFLLGKHLSELFHPADHGLIEELLGSPDENRLTMAGDVLPPAVRVHVASVKGEDADSRLVAYERAEILAMDVVPHGLIPKPQVGDAELSEDALEAADDYSIFIQLVGHRRSKEFFGSPALHFGTRHSSTFKITHVDESAANVIGFQPSELLGTPGYLYYHEDDLERIADEHKTLMKAGCCTTAYYRHLTKSNDWVWIRSHYYVTYEMWTGRALVVHGTHYLARQEDVRNNTPYSDLIQLGNAMKSGSSVLNKMPAAGSPVATVSSRSRLQSDDEDSSTTGFCGTSPINSMQPGGSGSSASVFAAVSSALGVQSGSTGSAVSVAAASAAAATSSASAPATHGVAALRRSGVARPGGGVALGPASFVNSYSSLGENRAESPQGPVASIVPSVAGAEAAAAAAAATATAAGRSVPAATSAAVAAVAVATAAAACSTSLAAAAAAPSCDVPEPQAARRADAEDARSAAAAVQSPVTSPKPSSASDESPGAVRLPQYAYSRLEKAFMKQSIELIKNQRQISEVGDDVEAIMEAATSKVGDHRTAAPSMSTAVALPSSQSTMSVTSMSSPQSSMSLSPQSSSAVTLATTAAAAGGGMQSSSPSSSSAAAVAAAALASLPGRQLQLSAVQQRLHEQLLKKYHELQALMELQQQELREVYQHLLLAAPMCTVGGGSSSAGDDDMVSDVGK